MRFADVAEELVAAARPGRRGRRRQLGRRLRGGAPGDPPPRARQGPGDRRRRRLRGRPLQSPRLLRADGPPLVPARASTRPSRARYMRARTAADRRARDSGDRNHPPRPGLSAVRRAVAELRLARTRPARQAPSIAAPTLLIWGRRDPVIPAEGRAGGSRGAIPGARLVVLDTGHVPPHDRPGRRRAPAARAVRRRRVRRRDSRGCRVSAGALSEVCGLCQHRTAMVPSTRRSTWMLDFAPARTDAARGSRHSLVRLPFRWNAIWKDGMQDGIVLRSRVSMNDYLIHRVRDIPRVAQDGFRLRHHWPHTDGALGLWFAALRGGRRQVSISVWRSPEDLQGIRPLSLTPADHARAPRHGGPPHQRVDGRTPRSRPDLAPGRR